MASKARSTMTEVRLQSFGSVTGLVIERGMCAEILMTWPEVTRIIEAYILHEEKKPNHRADIVAMMKKVSNHIMKQRVALRASVVIAQHRAKITPVIPSVPT